MADDPKSTNRKAPAELGIVPDTGDSNFGLPEIYSPVESTNFSSPAGGPPPLSPLGPRFVGSTPPALQLQTDLEKSSYVTSGNPDIPGQRLTPFSPSGTLGVNSAVQSQTPGIVAKSTAAGIAGQGTLATQNNVNPATPELLAVGSVPPSASAPFEYTSTTNSISLIYDGNFILRADGSSLSVPSGFSTITNLKAGRTYYFYPYWDTFQGSLEFVSFNDNIPELTGVTLNGSTGLVTTTTNQSIGLATAWSVEIWFRTTSATIGMLVEADRNQTGAPDTTNSTLGIGINASGEIFGGPNHNLGIWSTQNFADGAWHQACFTFAGGAAGIYAGYIDGAQIFSLATSSYTGVGTSYWRIGNGGYTGSSKFFNGTIGPVSIYSGTVLTAAQVANHYNVMIASGPASYQTTVAADGATYLWLLNEATGTVAAESIAGTNVGAYTGGFTLDQEQPVLTPVGTPSIAWVSSSPECAQQQNLRQFTALSQGAISAATTTSGTGGGVSSGQSVATCFSGNTLVVTDRGNVEIQHVRVGDEVETARGTWRKVVAVLQHEFEGLAADMGRGEFVTPAHRILTESKWVGAELLFHNWKRIKGTVYNLSVEAEPIDDPDSPDSENSYTLACGIVAHNAKLMK